MCVRYHTSMRSFRVNRGMSLVDVLVGSALMLIVFMGLFAIIRASLAVTTIARLKSSATTLVETRMEYIRSLPYDSVGTVGGIPAGIVPQYATTTLEGSIEFVTRTYIEYVDDPADGAGGADSNGITTDYKQVKVETTYTANSNPRRVVLTTNVVPPGIETTTGGGTLQVTVVDALGAPVSGASVQIVNTGLFPSVDVTTFTNAAGVVYLGGAEPSTEYEVYVTKNGYSSAQTYLRDATNVNPTPGYLTVVESQTTTSTFVIDVLSALTLRTFSPIAPAAQSDTFNDASQIVSSANTQVAGGMLALSGAPGSYPSSGEALASSTMPSYLATWETAVASVVEPLGTQVRAFVTDGSGVLIPDAVLPGNSSGFTTSITLSGVSTTTYPALGLKAELVSPDPNQTPNVLEWEINYTAGPVPRADVSFTLTGAKSIGSTALGASIFKTQISTTTDAQGTRTLDLEWDSYTISVDGLTTVFEDPVSPYDVLPGTPLPTILILEP